MIGSLVAAAALLGSNPSGVLDGGDLRGAMKASRSEPAAAPLPGRRFRISIPFVDGRKRDMKTFQSPARYEYKDGALRVIIGLGQITPDNYDQFRQQGLKGLPPLQSVFFGATQLRDEVFFRKQLKSDGYSEDRGVRNVTTVYGLAVPYADGQSALPPKFQPLMTYQTRLTSRGYRAMVDGMTLVLEGEVTALGQNPETFCGDYSGQLAADDVTQTTKFTVTSHQCFVTARIDKVTVQTSDRTALASWGSTRR